MFLIFIYIVFMCTGILVSNKFGNITMSMRSKIVLSIYINNLIIKKYTMLINLGQLKIIYDHI